MKPNPTVSFHELGVFFEKAENIVISHWRAQLFKKFFYNADLGQVATLDRKFIIWTHLCPDHDRECGEVGYCKECKETVPQGYRMVAALKLMGEGLE